MNRRLSSTLRGSQMYEKMPRSLLSAVYQHRGESDHREHGASTQDGESGELRRGCTLTYRLKADERLLFKPKRAINAFSGLRKPNV